MLICHAWTNTKMKSYNFLWLTVARSRISACRTSPCQFSQEHIIKERLIKRISRADCMAKTLNCFQSVGACVLKSFIQELLSINANMIEMWALLKRRRVVRHFWPWCNFVSGDFGYLFFRRCVEQIIAPCSWCCLTLDIVRRVMVFMLRVLCVFFYLKCL